jgi:AraC-like DNA-binding protein
MRNQKIDRWHPIGFSIWAYRNKNSGGMLRAHSHPDIELNFLTRGWIRYIYGGRTVTAYAGRPAIFFASVPHQTIAAAEDAEGVWATIPLALLLSWNLPSEFESRLLRGEFIEAVQDAETEVCDRFIIGRWPNDFQQKDTPTRKLLLLEIETRFRRLAQGMNTAQTSSAAVELLPGLESALSFLHTHYQEDIGVKDVAASANWHSKYLMRQFKQALKMTVGEYLMRLRISHAQWLLTTTQMSILDVAYESGYQSLAPFYEAFRKTTEGVTPLNFRKSALSE